MLSPIRGSSAAQVVNKKLQYWKFHQSDELLQKYLKILKKIDNNPTGPVTLMAQNYETYYEMGFLKTTPYIHYIMALRGRKTFWLQF